MPIALVKSAKGTSALASVTASFGSATTSGNLIVLGFAADDYNGTPDAGWTQSTGMEQQTFHGGYVWWRISTGETSFSYSIPTATNSAWVISEFSGVHGTPYDISAGQFQQTTSTAGYTTPAVIPTSGNRVAIAFMGASLAGSLATATWGSWLNSFTPIDSIGSGGSGTNDLAGLAYRLITGNGSTGYSSGATASSNTQSRSGLIIVFKEGATANSYTLPAATGSFTLTGQPAALRYGRNLPASTGVVALTGNAAILQYGRVLLARKLITADSDTVTADSDTVTADGASVEAFSLTGVAAELKIERRLLASTGSIALTGIIAGLKKGSNLPAIVGTFTLTGAAAEFKIERRLLASTGAFVLTGNAATFDRAYVLTADTGSFALIGNNANLSLGFTLSAFPGSFAVTGISAELKVARYLYTSVGSFALTGVNANFSVERRLPTSAGSFSVVGVAATLQRGYTVSAAAGSFALTGNNANLVYSATGIKLVAETGSFVFTGYAAALSTIVPGLKFTYPRNSQYLTLIMSSTSGTNYRLHANTGEFSLTGSWTYLQRSLTLDALSSAFNFTGSSANLTYVRNLPAEVRNFWLTGPPSTFNIGRSSPRIVYIPSEIRTVSVGAEARTITVPAENRTIFIPAEIREIGA